MEKEWIEVEELTAGEIYDRILRATGDKKAALEMSTFAAVLDRLLLRGEKEKDPKTLLINIIDVLSREVGIERVNGESLSVFEFKRSSCRDATYANVLTGGYLLKVLDKMSDEKAREWAYRLLDSVARTRMSLNRGVKIVETWWYDGGRNYVVEAVLEGERDTLWAELANVLCVMGGFKRADWIDKLICGKGGRRVDSGGDVRCTNEEIPSSC